MFSKPTNAINKATKSEDGYIVFSKYYNLPNKRVLFLTKDEKQKKTTLKIFSNNNLIDSLVNRTMEGKYKLLCIFPNGSFLLETYDSLIKICHNTLNTLSTQPWKQSYSASVIDNESFFIIKKNGNWGSQQFEHSLAINKWNEKSYEESNNIQLSVHPVSVDPKNGGSIENIMNISNNRYCCTLRGHNTSDFRVLIFDIDVVTNEVKERGVIKPKAQHKSNSSAASGGLVILPNSQLLTYHESNDNVQIWDTETLSCVKEWNWADIQKPEEFRIFNLKIKPFPDSTHLLVHCKENIYFFNTDKLTIKPIELGVKGSRSGEHHILSNGTILAFTKSGDYSKEHVNIMHFDLPEIMRGRKIMTESQHLVRLFFNRSGIPVEITNQIFSYAFIPQTKEMLARKIADTPNNEENQKYLTM